MTILCQKCANFVPLLQLLLRKLPQTFFKDSLTFIRSITPQNRTEKGYSLPSMAVIGARRHIETVLFQQVNDLGDGIRTIRSQIGVMEHLKEQFALGMLCLNRMEAVVDELNHLPGLPHIGGVPL